MAEPNAIGDPLHIRCPQCGATLTAGWHDLGESRECPQCGQPFDVTPPPAPRVSPGRSFQFQCLRCGSVLETNSNQAGQQGKCPSCAAVFIVPEFDPRTGLARGNADPGEDGENPAPVHAYAAAGAMAPQILRGDDDNLSIQCPRCQKVSAVSANNCPQCGLPFTMEGMTSRPATSGSSVGVGALALGLIALPMSLCGGVGAIPGLLAVALGLWGWSQREKRGLSAAQVGFALGLLGIAISAVVFLRLWR